MTIFAKSLTLAAAFAASAVLAQPDPHAGHHPGGAPSEAAPAKPAPAPGMKEGCGKMQQMMKDHMSGGQAMGPSQDKGGATGKGMMAKGCMSGSQAQSDSHDHGKAPPKAQ